MRSVAIHLALALAGLLAAYQTWTRGDDEQLPPPGEATMVQCQPGELRSFAMKSKSRNVMIEPRELDGEKAFWITVQNTGALSLADLAFGTVAGSSRLQVQALGRFPEELAPGEVIDIPPAGRPSPMPPKGSPASSAPFSPAPVLVTPGIQFS